MARQGGCSQCNCKRTRVLRTEERRVRWRGKEFIRIRRTRLCLHCGFQWYSLEMEEDELTDANNKLEAYESEET
jgi:transcriptional regulator NrdR family protein